MDSDRIGRQFLNQMVLIQGGFNLGRWYYLFPGGFAGLSQCSHVRCGGRRTRSPPQFTQSGSVLICSQYWATLYVSVWNKGFMSERHLKSIVSGKRYQRTQDQGRDLGGKDEKQVPGGLSWPKDGEGKEDGRKSGLRHRRVGDKGCHAWGFSTLGNEDSHTGPGYCRGLRGLSQPQGSMQPRHCRWGGSSPNLPWQFDNMFSNPSLHRIQHMGEGCIFSYASLYFTE